MSTLKDIIYRELLRLYPDGGPDPIAAAAIAATVERSGWRRITPDSVERAMWQVPNLIGDVDSAGALASELLREATDATD